MATNNLYPAVAINRFLWSQIEQAGIVDSNGQPIMVRSNYGGNIPIIPVEETPEFMTIMDQQGGIRSFPYIVYTWTRVNPGVQWYLKQQELAYAIRSTDDNAIRQLLNLFETLFQDYDVAAQRVNSFTSGPGGRESHRRYHFKYIHLTTLGGPMPAETENGPNESLVGLRIGYTES